jgi:hypothetical protein
LPRNRWLLLFPGLWLLLFLAVVSGQPAGTRSSALEIAGLVSVLVLAMIGPVLSVFWVADRHPRPVALAGLSLALLIVWTLALHPIMLWAGMRQNVWQNAINVGTVMAIALAFRGAIRGLKARRDLREAERLRILAEQRASQAQLSPHSLHNLLNTLYSTSLVAPSKVPELVLSLSQMMRYLAQSAGRDFSPLGEEWQFMLDCRRFALERSAPGSVIEMDHDPEVEWDIAVPTLVLASLFENALKHGRDSSGRLEVSVRLRAGEDRFEFRVENRIGAGGGERGGLGLGQAIARRRLAYLYPGRHRFAAGASGARYAAEVAAW